MRRNVAASILILCALFWTVPCLRGEAVLLAASRLPKERRETRYGIFFLGQRIGGTTIVEAPETFRGKPVLKVESSSRIRIAALGEVEQKVDLTQYLDSDWAPIHLKFQMLSAGHTTRVTADFFADRVECEIGSGDTTSKKTVPIPKGAELTADPQLLGGRKLKVGEKKRLYMFEPLTLQVLPLDLEVLREEKLTLDDKTYAALVVRTVNSVTGETTSWIAADGQLLQGTTALGIRMVREAGPEEKALQAARTGGTPPSPEGTPEQKRYEPPVDLAVATAVRTKTRIESPRNVTYLRARISGIPERRLILSDARQRATVEGGSAGDTKGFTAVYEVRSEEEAEWGEGEAPRPRGSYRRRGEAGGPQRYLKDAPYLNVEDARIRKKAREIVGDETDPLKKAAKIRAWVHATMATDASIGVPRSAVDVLATPKGVCRDYAVLFAALARAAGVPTRVVGGIVYFNDGFFYHAWNECLVDPARGEWRAFDATLSTDFVDATHIKFSQGDATEMFQAVRVVGRLQAEILEYR